MRYHEILNEDGLITKQNTTVDVKPGETKRQAAKFGFNVDPNGVPPIANTNGTFDPVSSPEGE